MGKIKNWMAGVLMLAAAGCANLSQIDPVAVVDAAGGVLLNRSAVVVGLTAVNPADYGGWAGDCPGCDLDAMRMVQFLKDRGISDIIVLQNEDATTFNFMKACLVQGGKLRPGGQLVVYVSGHGGQVQDVNGDEPDGLDETVCLWNGQLTDDLMGAMLIKMPADRDVVSIFDTCNSATMWKAPHDYVRVLRARERRGAVRCGFLHIAGCGDGESSYGGSDGGELTNAMLGTFAPGVTWGAWFSAIKRAMPRNQVAVFTQLNVDYTDRVAFSRFVSPADAAPEEEICADPPEVVDDVCSDK